MNQDMRLALERERARLQEERARLTAAQAKLVQDEAELEIAERVFKRLAGKTGLLDEVDAEEEARKEGISIPKNGTRRPNGVPTTRKMIDEVLEESERLGKDGLIGRDLVIGINDRWWPGVGWNDVLPEASRLVRNNQLARVNGLYMRVGSPGHARQLELLKEKA